MLNAANSFFFAVQIKKEFSIDVVVRQPRILISECMMVWRSISGWQEALKVPKNPQPPGQLEHCTMQSHKLVIPQRGSAKWSVGSTSKDASSSVQHGHGDGNSGNDDDDNSGDGGFFYLPNFLSDEEERYLIEKVRPDEQGLAAELNLWAS